MAEGLRSATDLIAECRARAGHQQNRIAMYGRLMQAYFGRGTEFGDTEIIPGSGDGRPLLRATRGWAGQSDLENRRGAPNLLRPVVDDFAGLRAPLPTITVLAEGPGEEAQEMAIRRTRALRHLYEISRMDVQQLDAAFYLSCLGDVLYMLEPLTPDAAKEIDDPFSPPGVYISVVNPMVAFPRFRGGREGRELEDVFLRWRVDRHTAQDVYGVRTTEDWVDLIQYISRSVKQTIVADRPAPTGNIVHDLGFCPAQWVSNKATDGRYAQSDIVSALDINEEAQTLYYLFVDSMVWAVFPMVEIHDGENTAEQAEVGPGAKYETQDTGAIHLHQPVGDSQAAAMVLNAVQDNLLKITGTAPVRVEGQIDRSNVSARSVAAQQGPMETRVAAQNTALGYHMERLNAKAMLMMDRIPELSKATLQIVGVEKATAYRDEFRGDEFGGWFQNRVQWDPLLGTSRHEKVVIAIQLFREGLVPPEYVLEQSGEDDPEALIKAAKAYHASQPPQEGPPGAGAPPGAPPGAGGTEAATEGAALGAGALGGGAPGPGAGAPPPPPTQPPPLPPFPTSTVPPNQKGYGSPSPLPDLGGLGDDLQQALSPLRGLQTPGSWHWQLVEGGVEITVADHRDVAAVRAAATPVVRKALGPDAKVSVHPAKAASNGRAK